MPIEISFDRPPAGYAVNAARQGEMASIQAFEFTSSEDGQHFVYRVEGFPNEIISKLPPESTVAPSQVDNLLAVIDGDGRCTAYVNELTLQALCRSAGPLAAGALIGKDDIVDIELLDVGVEIAPDAGYVFLFSIGWRKGLIYDLMPFGPDAKTREYDVKSVFGQAYCHVMFQDRFSISDTIWERLLAAKWFPFASLRDKTLKQLVSYATAEWNLDELLDDIADELLDRLPQMVTAWKGREAFAHHLEILERAVERFQDEDFVSCTGLVFPRIEGILRTYHSTIGAGGNQSQKNLASSAVAGKIDRSACLLLPRQFERYLSEVYFADFNPVASDIAVSRNSIGHGVAAASQFNKKSAVIGLLVVHHLFYCMS